MRVCAICTHCFLFTFSTSLLQTSCLPESDNLKLRQFAKYVDGRKLINYIMFTWHSDEVEGGRLDILSILHTKLDATSIGFGNEVANC